MNALFCIVFKDRLSFKFLTLFRSAVQCAALADSSYIIPYFAVVCQYLFEHFFCFF